MNGRRSSILTGSVACMLVAWAVAAPVAEPAKSAAFNKGAGTMRVYVGTYTGSNSRGIYTCNLDLETGKLSSPEVAAATPTPKFLAIHPTEPLLYAVSEMAEGGQTIGAAAAFRIEDGGRLTLLNQQSSGGAGPTYVSLEPAGKVLLLANYRGGSVASLPVRADGTLGPAASVIQHTGKSVHPERQEGPHAHSINSDPGGRFAIAADLGIDKVLVYRLDAELGKLTANDPPYVSVAPGAGPRHSAFHPDGRHVYVTNELASDVTVFEYDPDRGTLEERQTVSTLPEHFEGENLAAEVQVHPSGKFLYASNRGHESIAVFAIEKDGTLRPLGHTPSGGKTPRHFGIDPTGQYLLAAHQDSNNVVVFRIDGSTGALTPTGQQIEMGRPSCVKFRE